MNSNLYQILSIISLDCIFLVFYKICCHFPNKIIIFFKLKIGLVEKRCHWFFLMILENIYAILFFNFFSISLVILLTLIITKLCGRNHSEYILWKGGRVNFFLIRQCWYVEISRKKLQRKNSVEMKC